MANLRANNLTGTGGRNAIDGSVFFNSDGHGSTNNNSGLALADSTDWYFDGDFTIECWINPGKRPTTSGAFLGQWVSGGGTDRNVQLYIGTNGVVTGYMNRSTTNYSAGSVSALGSGEWSHIALVLEGTTLRFYLNGVQTATASVSGTQNNSTSKFFVGAEANASGNPVYAFNGYLSNVRVIKGTALYTGGTTFTPPTEKLKPIDGTVLLCCQDSDNPLQEATGKTITGYGTLQESNDIELVTNGGFVTDLSGWTTSGVQWTRSSGALMHFGNGNTQRNAYQNVTTVVGKRYVARVLASSAEANTAYWQIAGTTINYVADNNNSTQLEYRYYFTATSTSTQIRFYSYDSGNSSNVRSYWYLASIKLAPQGEEPNVLPPVGVDEGVVFEGDTKVNSQGYMYFPTGDTTQRGRGRAVIFSGYVTPSGTVNEIVYFDIATSGTSLRFGDLGIAQGATGGAAASETRAVYAGGWTSPGRDITYVTIATEGNSIDFGADRNGSGEAGYAPGCGNRTRGIFISSKAHPAYYGNTDFVTIATTGTCTDFGDVTDNRYGGAASASPTRAVYSGGVQGATSPGTNYISYCTIATTGSWANFGDLDNGSGGHRYTNGSSSDTRAIVYGGNYPGDGNMIQYITIASQGTNASDFGDAIKTGTHRGGFSNSIRGGAAGGFVSPGDHNTIEYVNIATTGNGIDWGDLTSTRSYNQGTTSDSHGGL